MGQGDEFTFILLATPSKDLHQVFSKKELVYVRMAIVGCREHAKMLRCNEMFPWFPFHREDSVILNRSFRAYKTLRQAVSLEFFIDGYRD